MTHHMDMPSEIDAITKVFHLLVEYRTRGSGLEALVLLEIARQEGCTSRYLQEVLEVDQSSISRVTRVLGDGIAPPRKRKPWDGRGLIYSYKDPEAVPKAPEGSRAPRADRLRYALTAKGRELLDGVAVYLSAYFPARPLEQSQQRLGLGSTIAQGGHRSA
ncbi:hypothetical protein ACGYLX_18895 [Sulfitobacter sp. 1A13496]|uniref:hypothetical protein n=1 Tax=Sulfitobacter sp. 1A13496 TaxID=3368596 RepID=UPI003745F240